MKIVNAEERNREQTGVKMAIFGRFGIGKTSLLRTMNEETLCLDLEAGMLAVKDWLGDSITIRKWEEARDIACLLGGANPAVKSDVSPYCSKHYEYVKAKYDLNLNKYSCIFIDSLTIASKLCLAWCRDHPNSYSERNGRLDLRAVYGLLASEMNAWLNQFQYIPDKDIVLVGLLEQKLDDLNRPVWAQQIEGTKTSADLPAILDEVICLAGIKEDDNGQLVRKFVCTSLNNYGYPCKDRSGKLSELEEPNLGKLLAKIKAV